ncbi:flagellar protein export ATPase FliI [Fodinisporobacter ferrooxydans]|uniref:Flagellar protein export ATPase FliI n=1 Tax=Fodinisporobacter ferrooxydans TaxID=2901836 RepID=A0ABY4CFQ3_9BACL|nr:flagellar protein export ATPase FliI [Alicyclobacillaceae bacterium MYW30-H2]
MRLPNERLQLYKNYLHQVKPIRVNGKVTKVIGITVESQGPAAKIGDICKIHSSTREATLAEVVGFRDHRVVLMPFSDMSAIGPGSEIVGTGESLRVRVGRELLGRIVNGLGEPIDSYGDLFTQTVYPAQQNPPNPLTRPRITDVQEVGVRAIDALLTIGRGQRVGVFAGSGVGKSTLLGMIARNTAADVNVIALIGERGREVREFIDKDLGSEGLQRSVVVVATSDQPPLMRIKGAFVATSIAEYFRDQGYSVNLMMDSVTRVAMAQREIGLAIGEPPTTKGYTPSVFALLPKLLERAGTSEKGTITGLYTVLVDGDDLNEPIADAVRGILDGHIVLSRDLANRGHFPAIDVLGSISRLMTDITDFDQRDAARKLRTILAVYRDAEDLIKIGAYQSGTNERVDIAIRHVDQAEDFLRQDMHEQATFSDSRLRLLEHFGGINI